MIHLKDSTALNTRRSFLSHRPRRRYLLNREGLLIKSFAINSLDTSLVNFADHLAEFDLVSHW